MADWMMVALTAVYVVATILICVFNYRSAKASREQTQELKRQYSAENRPYITIELLYEHKFFYVLRLTNHGKRVANRVKIQFESIFLESLDEPGFQQRLEQQNEKECIIGIGQHHDIFIGSNKFRDRPNQVPILAKITYSDSEDTYEDELNIDFASYSTFFSVNSDADEVKKEMEKQTRALGEICATLNCIAKEMRGKSELNKG